MRYDFRCAKHGVFEVQQKLADHTGQEKCPTCEKHCKQVISCPPRVDVEKLADAGCPGALETSGNRMEKRHTEAGQDHSYWRDSVS